MDKEAIPRRAPAVLALAVALALALLAVAEMASAAPSPYKQPLIRDNCYYSHSNLDDPIVDPAPGMGHLHDHGGNTTTNAASTGESLEAGPSNCTRDGHNSALWAPRLKWGGQDIVYENVGVYYRTTRGMNPLKTKNVPLHAQYIAGEGVGQTGKVLWHCGFKDNVRNSQDPPESCANQELGVEVHFPPCWNGEKPESGGWRLKEPVKVRPGEFECRGSHDIQIPEIQFFFDYRLPQADGPVSIAVHEGYTEDSSRMHADYFGGENLGRLVNRCINKPFGKRRPAACATRPPQ